MENAEQKIQGAVHGEVLDGAGVVRSVLIVQDDWQSASASKNDAGCFSDVLPRAVVLANEDLPHVLDIGKIVGLIQLDCSAGQPGRAQHLAETFPSALSGFVSDLISHCSAPDGLGAIEPADCVERRAVRAGEREKRSGIEYQTGFLSRGWRGYEIERGGDNSFGGKILAQFFGIGGSEEICQGSNADVPRNIGADGAFLESRWRPTNAKRFLRSFPFRTETSADEKRGGSDC
jgi:hypothetical protein